MENNLEKIIAEIVRAADDKKAEDITVLDVEKVSTLASYFVFCSGDNPRQNAAIADAVQERLARLKVKPLHTEGMSGSGWMLMDYGDVIIHIFLPDIRSFYDIEGLWADARRIDTAEILEQAS